MKLSFQAVTFYSSTSEKEKRGEIAIDGQCRVEVIPDSHSKSPLKTPGSKHHSKFQLFASEKTFEFQASDHRTRLQWVNAFRTAIGMYKKERSPRKIELVQNTASIGSCITPI